MKAKMEIWNSPKLKIKPLNNNAGKVFEEVINRLDNYWVSAGTALGLYREGDFIKDDTDLDFAFIGYDEQEKLFDYELIRKIAYEDKIMQLCYLKDDVLIDFYFHYLENDEYINYSESGKQVMKREIYDNREMIETKYGLLSFPSSIEEYLKIRYGDWKTPKKEKPPFEKI